MLPGGLKFADSFADLITYGPTDTGISVNELGEPLQNAFVASNTTNHGASQLPDVSCNSWLSDSKDVLGHTGLNAVALDDADWQIWRDQDWWIDASTSWSCDTASFHLYCLE